MSLASENFLNIFNNTTNSYKYFWWLAILRLIKSKNKKEFTYNDICVELIIICWYPINYFKLSFGQQDQLEKLIKALIKEYIIDEDIEKESLKTFLDERKDNVYVKNIFEKMIKYVPFRFLRPWFPELRGVKDGVVNSRIMDLQNDQNFSIPYKINSLNDGIIIEDNWYKWIIQNYVFIESFTFFNLYKYLEKNNPNTTNLSNKLFKPETRKLGQSIKVWKNFIETNNCELDVFESKKLSLITELSIDHFLPWSYYAHDQIWNLHPVEKSINSSKKNNIPDKLYLQKFIKLQYSFSRFLIQNNFDKFLQQYYFKLKISRNAFSAISEKEFSILFSQLFNPDIENAKRMGFQSSWRHNRLN